MPDDKKSLEQLEKALKLRDLDSKILLDTFAEKCRKRDPYGTITPTGKHLKGRYTKSELDEVIRSITQFLTFMSGYHAKIFEPLKGKKINEVYQEPNFIHDWTSEQYQAYLKELGCDWDTQYDPDVYIWNVRLEGEEGEKQLRWDSPIGAFGQIAKDPAFRGVCPNCKQRRSPYTLFCSPECFETFCKRREEPKKFKSKTDEFPKYVVCNNDECNERGLENYEGGRDNPKGLRFFCDKICKNEWIKKNREIVENNTMHGKCLSCGNSKIHGSFCNDRCFYNWALKNKKIEIIPDTGISVTSSYTRQLSPSQVSVRLIKIANAIDASRKPDRNLVLADIRRILASIR